MTVNLRLKEFSRLKNISNVKLGEIAGCSQQVAGSWFTKNVHIKGEYILKVIEEYKDLNARWLITGDGQMLEETSGNAVSEPSMVYGKDLFQLYTDEVRKNGMLEQKLRDLTGYGDDLKLGGAVTATSQRRPRGTARGRAG